MLVDHGVRIADLFRDLTERHGFVTAIGKYFACSRKDFAPQPFPALYPATWGSGNVTSILSLCDYFCDRLMFYQLIGSAVRWICAAVTFANGLPRK
jgi:hypothetical protein